MIGRIVSHYRIVEKLGAGGMGVVYRAEDLLLGRFVALKFLHSSEDVPRLLREAKTEASLNHPNICAVHDVDPEHGFIAMELVEGQSLAARIAGRPLPVEEAIGLAVQICEGLQAAHDKGITHRDIKSGNILITPDGHAKILDFGLARVAGQPGLTQEGAGAGTPGYMAPEQMRGEPADRRTDIWAAGAVLHEMLTGRPPMGQAATLPEGLSRIVRRALAAEPGDRYQHVEDMLVDLRARAKPVVAVARPKLRRRWFAGAVITTIVAAGVWLGVHTWRIQWAENEAIPQAARLAEKGNYAAAFVLAQRAEQIVPASKALARLLPDISQTVSIETVPAGAEVEMKDYAAIDAPWVGVGRSPLKDLRIARGYFRLRATKEGFTPAEGAAPAGNAPVRFLLEEEGAATGMVPVPAAQFAANLAGFGYIGPFPLAEFRIDRFEVTNRQFKEFVDQGGYRKREFWKHPFVKDGRGLSFEQALAEFVDATGRPGPSTWEAGTYLSGKDEFPVSGVSWYEAAAYAEFAGKSLPTIYHWYRTAAVGTIPYVIPFSNLGGAGPDRVGRRGGLGPYGTYDMLGNVREWCWNEEAGGRRYILGGAWDEPEYLFYWSESREPFDRTAANGFRCVKYTGEPPASLLEPRARRFRDYSKEKPLSDEAFRVIRSMYTYQHLPLAAAVISEDSGSEYWRKQKITYSAGYGNERITAYLFLPKRAAPPYQTVVFFPGSGALTQKSSETLLNMDRFEFLVKSGRALLYPVYKGSYERQVGLVVGEQNREIVGQWIKELGHSVDYLESRTEVDKQRLAYCGFSWGARLASILLAFEDRFRTALLVSGGFGFARKDLEIDDFNFAPRVKTPVLMINGKYDFLFPVETSQKPMFRLLGSADKRHITIGGAHDPFTAREETIREALDWLDQHLGPVKME